jgi:predicted transcriptional regulator of viral defense system
MGIKTAVTPIRALPEGIHRTRDLTALGMTRTQVRRLVVQGRLICLARGLYCTPTTQTDARHTLAEVSKRAPRAVIALTSALQFHNLTTQNPWQVCLLLPPSYHVPRIESPPIWAFRATGETLAAGVEEHCIEGVTVRVTCVAKTVADCFKYRSRIGLDVALEALTECLRDRRASVADLNCYARLCRVEQVIRPYIEGILEALSA